METDRWKQIDELYNAALPLPYNDRATFLAKVCAEDETLKLEVLSLLKCADSGDGFLEQSALSLGLEVLRLESQTMIGSTVGRYHLMGMLGHGGMGEVYLAHDPRLNRRVALKMLPISITGDRERVLRFEHEARAASAISHPNVAHIYEIGKVRGRRYITMEYVRGQTLRQRLRQEHFSHAEALDTIIQVAAALVAAHAAGVVHRDIKPENILLRDDGYVKVLDFGLAKLVENSSPETDSEPDLLPSLQTKPGLLMGTSHYMSPEQLRRQRVDVRTDLWSLGVVLYEILTGRRPFEGESLSQVIVAILEKEPEPSNSIASDLSPGVQKLLVKALKKNPDERYQTADALLADLRDVNHQLRISPMTLTSSVPAGIEPKVNALLSGDPFIEARISTTELGRLVTIPGRTDTKHESSITDISTLVLKKWRLPVALTIMVLIASVAFYSGLLKKRGNSLYSTNFNLRFERPILSGVISDIVLSPDGKYIAYVVVEEGKHVIHLTELTTSSDLRITPASEKEYGGLSFSPDGTYVYYLEKQIGTGMLYRVSKFGGAQRKIITNINTPVAFSPHGDRIAFVRANNPDDTGDLITADADGTGEKTLTRRTRKDSDLFPTDTNGVGPAWSADGKLLACATVNWTRNPREMNVEVVDADTGLNRRLNSKPWYDISRIAWLADGSGVIVAGAESSTTPGQLAMLAYPGGQVRRITNDSNNYSRVSTTVDSQTLLTLNVEENSSIWVLSSDTENHLIEKTALQKTGVSEIAWREDGSLIYTRKEGGNVNLWLEDVQEQSTKQLTYESSKNLRPAVSPDGRFIVFVSSRAGLLNVWRIEADGTTPKQLTFGPYEDMPCITADNKWVVYRTATSIWKVPLESGAAATQLLAKTALFPVSSPDGRLLAFFSNERPDNQEWYLEVIDLDDLTTVKRFEVPDTANPFKGLRWTPDGSGLAYISNAGGGGNIWVQLLSNGQPQQVTNFKDAEIGSFAWTPDGKQLGCVRNTRTYIPVLLKLS